MQLEKIKHERLEEEAERKQRIIEQYEKVDQKLQQQQQEKLE